MNQPGPSVEPRRATVDRGLVALGVVLLVASLPLVLVGMWRVFGIAYGSLPEIDTWITAEARTDGGSTTVTGTTNLPDGALVYVSVGPAGPTAVDGPWAETVAPVADGRLSVTVDPSSLPEVELETYVSFGFGWEVDQPLSVAPVYGPSGERLAGEDVWSDSGDTLLEVTVPVRDEG